MGNDVDLSPHVECLLYRQTMPIARWLTTLKKMNTRYIHNGSRLQTDRWLSLDAAGPFLPRHSCIAQNENVQMYLVKWRNLSYLHCSWETEQELIDYEGPHMKQKLQVCALHGRKS